MALNHMIDGSLHTCPEIVFQNLVIKLGAAPKIVGFTKINRSVIVPLSISYGLLEIDRLKTLEVDHRLHRGEVRATHLFVLRIFSFVGGRGVTTRNTSAFAIIIT